MPSTIRGSDNFDSSYKMTLGTALASTSGTSIDFTGIPSWAKRVTVMFNGVSTSGASNWLMQIGAGPVQTTGYDASGAIMQNALATTTSAYTTGFGMPFGAGAAIASGIITIDLISSNAWVASGSLGANGSIMTTAGSKTLSGALDRVRITTVNGTDTFDAGSINILYEG